MGMSTADYYDMKGWSRDEHRADHEMERHEELLLLDAWDALWWHQVEPDDETEAYYLRCLRAWDGGDL